LKQIRGRGQRSRPRRLASAKAWRENHHDEFIALLETMARAGGERVRPLRPRGTAMLATTLIPFFGIAPN